VTIPEATPAKAPQMLLIVPFGSLAHSIANQEAGGALLPVVPLLLRAASDSLNCGECTGGCPPDIVGKAWPRTTSKKASGLPHRLEVRT
jgi:hypothetical protein